MRISDWSSDVCSSDLISYGLELNQFGGTETRDGALGVIQFEPNPGTRFLIDGYWSRFDSDVRRRGVRFSGAQNGNTATGTLTDPIVVNDAIVGGHWQSGNGVNFESINQRSEEHTSELQSLMRNS